MKKTRKHTERGGKYQAMAVGYQAFKSPLAQFYGAAAEHYHENDPPILQSGESEGHASTQARAPEREAPHS